MIKLMDHPGRFRITLRLWKCLMAILAMVPATTGCGEVATATPDDVRQFRPITHAVYADNRLWLLHDDGSLVSLAPDDAQIHKVDAGGKVLGICRAARGFSALVEKDGMWALKQPVAGGWAERASASSGGERILAMDCDAAGAVLVTNNRLLELAGDQVQSVRLSQTIEAPYVTATALATDDVVWLGLNSGEWGGGLRRISRSEGRVDTIGSNRSGELCGGPLNTECDPVNGLVESPRDSSCVIAAVGLVHMVSHGRIVEVCGDSIRRLYFKPFDPQPPRNTLDDGEPASTVAFFGLARMGDRVRAVGLDGTYRFDDAHSPRFQPLPEFENKGGYSVSFDDPEVAFVMTEANARASLSGSVPLMAAR